jgi:hypothetical protein
LALGRRARNHPDQEDARAWVEDEIDRLQALGYGELVRLRSSPHHHAFSSRTGRQLVGETSVHWDGGEVGPLRVVVDVWEPRRWRLVRRVYSDDFSRLP